MNVGDSSPGQGGKQSQEVDLNLAPIIDCFTVLIIFILASASYLAIGILETNLAVEGPASTKKKPPSIRLDIELTMNKEISIRASAKGKIKKKESIPAQDSEYDLEKLLVQVKKIKKKWPDTTSAVLSAADNVEYRDVIIVMDTIRPELPSILLGGL